MRRRAVLLQAAATGALLSFAAPAAAQPIGAQVIAGQASVLSPSSSSTIINQSTSKAIINWQNFSVGAGASVQFNQPDSASLTLNRVVGGGLSAIDGTVSANGQVWLINPNGVLFGQGAQVNVGGLLASTADIANADFLSGNYAFAGAPAGSSVINKGALQAASGGAVVLSAPTVSNSGLITATAGHVVLGGADAFTVDFKGDHLLSYAVTAPAHGGGVSNSGVIKAPGGQVLLTARAAADIANGVVNNSGTIEATSARLENGEIVLDAGDGEAVNSGTLDASGRNAGESGGTVRLTGKTVTVADGATIDVSGDAGGGMAAIGGALHGAGPGPNARTVTVGKASIKADALTRGNGGTVAVYGTGQTSVAASISAKGGARSGNGGQVETSGHDLYVDDATSVVTAALNGASGNWLLDPQNILISTAGTQSASQAFASNQGTTANISPVTINSALANGNVTLQANTDITVGSDLTITAITANKLTLDAGRSVILSGGGISYANGSVSLIGNDPAAVAADRLAGSANLVSNNFAVTASSVDLILFTNGASGAIGSSSKSFNVLGQTYVQTSGGNAYLATADNSLTLGNSGHALAVDMGTGDLTIASNGVVQTAPLSVHALSISLLAATNATGNPVALTNVSNAITGNVSVAARGGTFGGSNQIEIVNNGALSAGPITVTPNPTGNGDYGAISLTSKTASLTLTGAVSGGGITLNGATFVLEAANGTIVSHHTGDNTIAGGLAINAGGGITLANANIIEAVIGATGNGNETAVIAPGEIAYGAGGLATITVGNSVALYAASAGGATNINVTGSVSLTDVAGNAVIGYNGIDVFNPVSSAGFITLHAAGNIRQRTDAGDVHITTAAGLSATSDNGLISLPDGGKAGITPDPGNQIGGYAIFNSHGDTSFANTITTVIGGPSFPGGAPNGYIPPASIIGGNLTVEVNDANQTGGAHSNLILAGEIRAQNDAGITVLHATGDLDNNSGSGTILADNLSLISDFGSVGGDDGTQWSFGLGANSSGPLNLHASAANAIVINPGDLNIGVTGLTGGLTSQSVLIFANGAITQNSDSSGVISTGSLDVHSFSNGDITLDNRNNVVTAPTFLRTTGTIRFTNSVTTYLNQASGDDVDANGKPLLAGDVTITVQDPSGATHPDLHLGVGTIYDSNNVAHSASIESSASVLLTSDGGVIDDYTPGSGSSGHVFASSLQIMGGNGAISLTNPASDVGTFGATTNNQAITFITQQSSDLTIANGGIDAGLGGVLLQAPQARILGNEPIVGSSLGLVATSMVIADVEAQTVSAYSSGGEIQIASSGALTIANLGGGAGIDSKGGAVVLLGDSVSQASGLAGAILAGDLEAAASTSVTLNSASNAASGNLVLISGGSASFFNSVTTHVSTSSTVGQTVIQSAGDLVINNGAGIYSQATSGDGVILVAGANFINNSGAGAISVQPNARWLVYSASPSSDVFNNLNSNNVAVFSKTYPGTVSQTGNRYVFAGSPLLTVTAGNMNKVYGNDVTAALDTDFTVAGGAAGVTGAYLGDSAATYSGAPSITSLGAAATADVGSYAIQAGQGTFQAANGYNVVFQGAQLTVGQRPLTAALQGVTKVYDGTPAAALTLTNYALTGIVNNDAVSLANYANGLYADASAGTAKNVVVTGLALTGARAGNYTLAASSISGAVGTIQQKALTLALQGTVSKTFDGTTAATLTDSNYSALGGIVGQDAVALASLPTSGSYADATAGTGKTVTVSGLTLAGAKSGNYSIPATVSGSIGIILAGPGAGGNGGDTPGTPEQDAQLITATIANQNANQPTRPGSFYLDTGTTITVPPAGDTTPAPVPMTAVLTPAAVTPIAELVSEDSGSSGGGEPASPADQASDFLVASMEGGGRAPPGTLIPGLLRTGGRTRGNGGVINNLSAWGNPALWQ